MTNPVTDEELARMQEACNANLKKGLFAISVAVRDLIRLLDEIKRLRTTSKEQES